MKKVTIEDEVLNKVHDVEVEILDEIVRICKKHNIAYYLIGGTLLGAIRHKDFIPWDDDLDIGMLREDYEKFLEIALYELSDKYYLETRKYNKKFYLQFSKVKKNYTDFKEDFIKNLDCHKGIFVDIFPFDNIKNPSSKITKLRGAFITYGTQTVFVKYKFMKLKDCHRPLFCFFYRILPLSLIFKIQAYLMTRDNKKNTDYLSNYVGRYSITKESFEKKYAEESVLVDFHGKKYNAFKEYDKYLTGVYGDYMKLPPEEERINHCPVDIDFEHGKNIRTIDLIKK